MHRSSFCRRCWPNSIGSSWSSRLPTLLKYLRWLIRLTRLATFAMDITRVISCWSSQSYCLMLSWQVTRLTKELCHCSYLRSDCPQNESREDSWGSWNACHHLLTRCLADSSPEMLNFNIWIEELRQLLKILLRSNQRWRLVSNCGNFCQHIGSWSGIFPKRWH